MRPSLIAAIISGASVPSSVYDLTAGVPSGWTFTRTGADRLARASTGKWARYVAGSPRVHYDTYGVALGLVMERAFTDKGRLGFNFSAAPTDSSGSFFATPNSVAMTPDPEGLDQAGWENIITSSLRFTAPSTDIGNQIETTTGNTNPHSIMALVRDNQGTGGTTPSGVSMSGNSVVGPSVYDEWTLVRRETMTPTSTSRISQVTTRTGHNFDVAGLWFVEAAYMPLPYWRTADNTAATIGDEYATAALSGVAGWSASGCTLVYEWWHDRPFTVAGEPLIALIDADGADYVAIAGAADGTLTVTAYIGGSTVYSASFAAPSRDAAHAVAVRCVAGQWIAAADGVLASGASVSPSLSNIDTLSLNKRGSLVGNQFARSVTITQASMTDDAVAAASLGGGIV